MYDLFGIISVFALLLFNFFSRKEKQLSSGLFLLLFNHLSKSKKVNIAKLQRVFWFIETFIISLAQYMPILLFNIKFGNLVNTNANYFGLLYFAPVVLSVFFLFFFIDPLKQSDLITPAYPLALFFAKLGCFFHGCCYGIESASGLFNHETNLVEFPVQLVEAGLAMLVFIFLLFYRKKASMGTLFPVYMILYSSTRFFSEFFRGEPVILFGLKTYQILCIIGVILGALELLAVKKIGNRILKFYNTIYEFNERKFNSYVASVKNKRVKNIVHHKKKKR